MGIMGVSNSNVRTVSFKDKDGKVVGTMTVSKPSTKKMKRLQYNFKRISTQIMRAKTSGNARQAMSKAKIETASLRRKLRTGEYDDRELKSAIIHAEQMERIAKKRMKHLQEEENIRNHNGICQGAYEEEDKDEDFEVSELDSEEMKKLMQEIQAELDKLENQQEMEILPQEDMDPEDLELLKKKHRSEEMREIMEADMKYLKALFDKLAKDKQEASSASSGVALELGGTEVPIPMEELPAPEVPMAAEGGSMDILV